MLILNYYNSFLNYNDIDQIVSIVSIFIFILICCICPFPRIRFLRTEFLA